MSPSFLTLTFWSLLTLWLRSIVRPHHKLKTRSFALCWLSAIPWPISILRKQTRLSFMYISKYKLLFYYFGNIKYRSRHVMCGPYLKMTAIKHAIFWKPMLVMHYLGNAIYSYYGNLIDKTLIFNICMAITSCIQHTLNTATESALCLQFQVFNFELWR